MGAFALSLPASVLFGRGQAATALEALASGSARILLVRGSSGFADVAEAQLAQTGRLAAVIRGSGEPDLPALNAALDTARAASPDHVLAIGGGSVIDLGKAIAALVVQDNEPMAYLEGVGEGRALDHAPLAMTAMPTTAGTGAEVTKNAVIGVPEHRRKVSLRDPRMVPDVAVVDPSLTDDCPRNVTLASGLDAVVQVIEPFLSIKANIWTDALCRDAIPRGLTSLQAVMATGSGEARDGMAYTSLCGGLALANSGLGAVHGLAGVLGGRTEQAHGLICGRLLGPILTANAAAGAVPDRMKAVLGMIGGVFNVPSDQAVVALEAWIDDQGLDRLVWRGDDEALQWVHEAQGASSMRGNPVKLSDASLVEAIRQAAGA